MRIVFSLEKQQNSDLKGNIKSTTKLSDGIVKISNTSNDG